MHSQFNNIFWVGFSSPNHEIRYIWIGPYLRTERLKTWICFEQIINLDIKSFGGFLYSSPSFCSAPPLSLSLSLPLLPLPPSLFSILFSMSFTCRLTHGFPSCSVFFLPITLAVAGRSFFSSHPGEMDLSVFSAFKVF